jgi:hypothetical protein
MRIPSAHVAATIPVFLHATKGARAIVVLCLAPEGSYITTPATPLATAMQRSRPVARKDGYC